MPPPQKPPFSPAIPATDWNFTQVPPEHHEAVCWWEYAREAYRPFNEDLNRRFRAGMADLDFSHAVGYPKLLPHDSYTAVHVFNNPASKQAPAYKKAHDFLDYLMSATPKPMSAVQLIDWSMERALDGKGEPRIFTPKITSLTNPQRLPLLAYFDLRFADQQIIAAFTEYLAEQRNRLRLPNPSRRFHPVTLNQLPFPADHKAALGWLAIHRLRLAKATPKELTDDSKYGCIFPLKTKPAMREIRRRQDYAEVTIQWLVTGEESYLEQLPSREQRRRRRNLSSEVITSLRR
jgi:hypothetical protein